MKTYLKKIFIIVLLASCCNIYFGCKRSDLDLLPHGPTEASFFTKESDFTKAVLGVYAKINDVYWYNGGPDNTTVPVFLLPGDDITTNQNNEEFEQFSPIQSSSQRVDYFYKVWYQLIARANVVLEKIDKVEPGIYITPNLQDYNKGEALFLRGYANYNLWNYFGTAPLVTERVSSTDQFTPPGTTGTQLLDQAIIDFEEAANLLPQSWADGFRGRATKNSAYGMLGKSLVFRASATKNTADYGLAITALDKITGASLVADFGENFAWDAENNSESLFEYQATQAFAFDNVWLSNDFDNAVGNLSVFWGFYDDNFALFGKSRFFGTTKLFDAFDATDPRRDLTVSSDDRTIKKYVTVDKLGQSGVGSVNNPRILRYSDALLLKAEAVLQSNGSTSEAIGLVNQVRARARNMGAGTEPADYPVSETNTTTIMDWIIKERFIELAGEGQRWLDLRRWQMQGIITLDNAFFNSNTTTVSFQLPKHLLLPIPNSEIDVNPNVVQNQGY